VEAIALDLRAADLRGRPYGRQMLTQQTGLAATGSNMLYEDVPLRYHRQ
jgi:hypothetical protein